MGPADHRSRAPHRLHPVGAFALGLALAAIAAGPASAQTLTRGPYLQLAAPERIVVRWRTDLATDSRVRYGLAPGSLAFTSGTATPTTEHRVALEDLAPATRYFYSVGSSSSALAGGDSAHSFVTPPAAGVRAPIRFWAFGDGGTGTEEQRAVRDAYLDFAGRRGPAHLWLLLGDNAYPWGADADYESAFFDVYPDVLKRTPAWVARGNHDLVYPGTNDDLFEIFDHPGAGEAGGLASGSEAYWSFDHGNAHFVCLDSEETDRSPGGAMLTWLAADLAATQQEWVIAFWHSPPYTKGGHDSDNFRDSAGRMAQMRDWALPVLEAAGVDLVLSGHSHTYERSFLLDGHYGTSDELTDSNRIDAGDGRIDGDGPYRKPTPGKAPHEGAVFVVAGSAGEIPHHARLDHPVMVAGLRRLGSFVGEIDGLRLDGRFLDDTGAVLDSFTILKGAHAATGPLTSAHAASLEAPRPNPSRGATRLAYRLPGAGVARITIFDLGGRRLLDQQREHGGAGRFEVEWSGRDARGRPARPGIYLVELSFGGERRTARLVRLE